MLHVPLFDDPPTLGGTSHPRPATRVWHLARDHLQLGWRLRGGRVMFRRFCLPDIQGQRGEGHLRLSRKFLLRVAAVVSAGNLSTRDGTLRRLCWPTLGRTRWLAKSTRRLPSQEKRTVARLAAARAKTCASLDRRTRRPGIPSNASWMRVASMCIASPR